MTHFDERDTLRNWLTGDGSGPRTMPSRQSPIVVPSPGAAPASREPVAKSDEEPKPRFNPFKFQRITLPPGLRADFIRWSKAARDEQVPEDTVPPNARVGQQHAWRGDPAGESGVRRSLPRWMRRTVTGVVLAALFLGTTLVVARWGREKSRSNASKGESIQPAATQPAPIVAQPPVVPSYPLVVEQHSAPAVESSAPVAAEHGEPAPTAPAKNAAGTERRKVESRPAGPTFKTGPEAVQSESALDRPFSPPR